MEFAIAQTETKQHDKAILTFQKYFSAADGTARHMSRFARSLAAKEYFADSKEWYYKALRINPTNLGLAEEMISMLRGATQFGEALSIIGHYNLSYPQTRKIWNKLALDVKSEFNGWLETRKFAPTIKALKHKLSDFAAAELDTQRKKNADFNEAQAELISNNIIQKITNHFAHHLKDDDVSTDDSLELIKKVFQLEPSTKNV
mgnify:CR=1 FL=1